MNPVRRGAGISKGIMRTAITLATPHDGPTVFLSGPSVPIQQQKDEIKRLKGLREHAEYAEVELWDSGSGIVSKVKFDKPKAATPPAPPANTPPPEDKKEEDPADSKEEEPKTPPAPPAPPAETKRKK